jgi:hypothetical protein
MMSSRVEGRSPVARRTGLAVGLVGAGFVGGGVWGRREAARALARERILHPGEGGRAVASAGSARSLAEFIRRSTVDATGGRTFAEIEPYVDAAGTPTGDRERAARDARTGAPAENPDHDLWIQSTTLQTALMQAYMAFRISDAMAGLGAALVAVGFGLAAAGRRGG